MDRRILCLIARKQDKEQSIMKRSTIFQYKVIEGDIEAARVAFNALCNDLDALQEIYDKIEEIKKSK